MSSEEREVDEEQQQTPTGHTIPVPSRDEVFRDLAKVAKASPPKRADDDSDGREGGAEDQ